MSLVIQIATLLGILLIILLSYESLVHMRRAAVRESLEQLDDIRFAAHEDINVKTILYRCRGLLLRRSCEVKFTFYGAALPGASDPGVFLEFPDDVFGDFDVWTDGDGYIVTMRTNNPVEIRRNANEIMRAMYDYDATAGRDPSDDHQSPDSTDVEQRPIESDTPSRESP